MPVPAHLDAPAILLSDSSRALRGRLRPLVWVTLEEVALDATIEDGRVLAHTSARRVAERLRVDPGSAAGALGELRRRGFLDLDGRQADRFGLSVYLLRPIAGLTVLPAGGPAPHPGWGGPGVGSASS